MMSVYNPNECLAEIHGALMPGKYDGWKILKVREPLIMWRLFLNYLMRKSIPVRSLKPKFQAASMLNQSCPLRLQLVKTVRFLPGG